jgi:hypothetical protein
MAGQLSRAGLKFVGNSLLYQTQTKPSTLYIGLASAGGGLLTTTTLSDLAPTNSSGSFLTRELKAPGSSVLITGYSRVAVTFAAGSDTDPVSWANTNLMTFGPLTIPSGVVLPVTYVFMTDAASGTSGTIYAFWTVANVRTPANGDSITIPVGSLTLGGQ